MEDGRQMTTRKICVAITARASYSRIRSALSAIQSDRRLELQIVAAASSVLDRYGNAVKFIQQDGFPVHARIFNIVEGENLVTSAKSTGLGLVEMATVLANLEPDLVVTIADRYETIATSIAAAYMNIPLVHLQGGEITGSIDEKVRHANTKLADIHFVCSTRARDRVIRMGERPDRVFITGCPSIDLADQILREPTPEPDPFRRFGGVGPELDLSNGYLIVLQHPVTTEYESARSQAWETLRAIAELDMPTLWFWPNVDAGSDGTSNAIRAFRELHHPRNIHFFKHVDSLQFLRLAYHSCAIVGNSSVAIRECSFLGIPAVNIGTRQQGRDRGSNVIDVGHDQSEIVRAVRSHIRHGHFASDPLYGDGQSGRRIADLLATVPLTIEKTLYEGESLPEAGRDRSSSRQAA
jgi:UDP-hydrolysing UDP-N-acetyl-D-glucosamine 2-epimerase